MTLLVFAQLPDASLSLSAVAAQARAHFGAEVVATFDEAAPRGPWTLDFAGPLGRGTFRVSARRATAEDQSRAREAEVRGRAGGMASLAARCPTLLAVEPVGDASDALLLEFCALLASVGLGPILPPDGSTLLGVKSARELAKRPERP